MSRQDRTAVACAVMLACLLALVMLTGAARPWTPFHRHFSLTDTLELVSREGWPTREACEAGLGEEVLRMPIVRSGACVAEGWEI